MSSVYNPRSNGLVERLNQTILRGLRRSVGNRIDEWENYLPRVLFSYRTKKNEAVGVSPFTCLFGYEPENFVQQVKGSMLAGETLNEDQIRELRKRTRECAQEKVKTRLDLMNEDDLMAETQFKVGEMVLLFNRKVEAGIGAKLDERWLGPFIVSRIGQKDSYYICSQDGRELVNPYNVRRMKRYFKRVPQMFYGQIFQEEHQFKKGYCPGINNFGHVSSSEDRSKFRRDQNLITPKVVLRRSESHVEATRYPRGMVRRESG